MILKEQGIDIMTIEGGNLAASMLENQPTYQSVMTNDTYNLSAFLAKVTSAHNRGIALDLTLRDRNSDEDIPMQSKMHDLSWNSVVAQDNENARLLESYMTEAGFAGLSSEWWHFQDDETRTDIGLNGYLEKGVSIEGWKSDNIGWRYQKADGSFYKAITVEVEGTMCGFDENGYLVE